MAYYKSDEVYARALDELREGDVDEETFAIALAESDGDDRKAKVLYIKLRAKQYNKYFEAQREHYALQQERIRERKERGKRREERERQRYRKHLESIDGSDRLTYVLIVFGATLLVGTIYYTINIMPINTSKSFFYYFILMFNYIIMILYALVALGLLSFIANYIPKASKVADVSRIDDFCFYSDFTPLYWLVFAIVAVHVGFSLLLAIW